LGGQCRAIQRDALLGEDLSLQVIGVLGDKHLRYCRFGRQPPSINHVGARACTTTSSHFDRHILANVLQARAFAPG
jgi:hypothetical protein